MLAEQNVAPLLILTCKNPKPLKGDPSHPRHNTTCSSSTHLPVECSNQVFHNFPTLIPNGLTSASGIKLRLSIFTEMNKTDKIKHMN